MQAHVVPWKLWFAVGGLLIADIVLLTVWTVVDPLKRDVHNFKKEPSDDPEQDIEFQPQLEHCKSSHHSIWMGRIKYLFFTRNIFDNIELIFLLYIYIYIYIYN